MPGYVGLFSCTPATKKDGTVIEGYNFDCPVMSGFFHTLSSKMKQLTLHLQVIARLCRAFFMHTRFVTDVATVSKVFVIARLCRAFFMHNCINFGINNGVNKNHLIFVLLMSVFYYSSFSFTFE